MKDEGWGRIARPGMGEAKKATYSQQTYQDRERGQRKWHSDKRAKIGCVYREEIGECARIETKSCTKVLRGRGLADKKSNRR